MVAEYALLDSGSGLTFCPINFADDLPLLPRLVNLPILSNATGGSMECIGLGQVGCRFGNGEPFRKSDELDHLELVTGANIEVEHAKNESSMIMERSGTRTSVVLQVREGALVQVGSR